VYLPSRRPPVDPAQFRWVTKEQRLTAAFGTQEEAEKVRLSMGEVLNSVTLPWKASVVPFDEDTPDKFLVRVEIPIEEVKLRDPDDMGWFKAHSSFLVGKEYVGGGTTHPSILNLKGATVKVQQLAKATQREGRSRLREQPTDPERGLGYIIPKTLRAIRNGVPPDVAFVLACEDENYYGDRADIRAGRERAAEILKIEHDVDVGDPHKEPTKAMRDMYQDKFHHSSEGRTPFTRRGVSDAVVQATLDKGLEAGVDKLLDERSGLLHRVREQGGEPAFECPYCGSDQVSFLPGGDAHCAACGKDIVGDDVITKTPREQEGEPTPTGSGAFNPETDPRRPRVRLVGTDGNAFALLGKMRVALRKAGYKPEEIKLFLDDAMGGDYNHLLQTCMKWADVD